VMTVAAVAFCVGGGVARSQGAAAAAPEHTAMSPDQIKWVDGPPNLPKGAKMAVLYGDPGKAGMFIVRFKMPANYKIMPHTHPTDENVSVVSGAFAIGMGDTMDMKTKALPVGSFFSMPAKMHHFAFTKKETTVDVSGMGPLTLTYLNPADDPSKQTATK
jgi:quercetin dioxygenase-like cupin family protein